MAKKKTPLTHHSDVALAVVPTSEPARLKSARQALPFVHSPEGGAPRFWPEASSLTTGNIAQQRVEGERWALELLRYYREFGHEPAARILPDLIRHGVSNSGAGEEQFTGFVRVLDAMLAFAARQSDLDDYARALGAEHHRTLAAWAALDADG
jgi:hypothetical protein